MELSAVVFPVCTCGKSIILHDAHDPSACAHYTPSRPIENHGIISVTEDDPAQVAALREQLKKEGD